ncbi:zinc-dependent alcohol dehydrogenase family protein [Enterocloster lavalensis]|uniref:zinc-dependent alcohol dehydrogenase family protein n=1 Tax=Enterocloster lavalensis TaxID=460384 RepID=UPI0023F0D8AC|nr:zinc-dependent alcohol dehydrogenase family protein [Enterocloster lavalensis]
MRGNYFLGEKQFCVKEIPLPEVGDCDVLVRVGACGVCGTDVHIYHGSKGSAEVHPPVILGHELAGIAEKVGSAVTGVKPGDHVTVDPNIYCGKCHFCQIGKKQLCENLYAVGVNRDGGFAEFCLVPETQCYQLDREIPLKYGAMTEPLACCIHGIDRVGIRPGNTVCVIGGGAIGLIMVQLAKLSGAARVVLSEPVAMRREIGLKVGADAVLNPLCENLGERLEEILGAPGADVVIECVGTPAAAAQAFEAAAKGAAILLFSVPQPDSTCAVNLEDVFHKELTIAGSIINPDTHGRAVALINSGAVRLEPLITHSFPVDQVEQAILAQESPETIKVIVEP